MADRKFDFPKAAFFLTLILLAPALMLRFLRLDMADGAYGFVTALRCLRQEALYGNFDVYAAPLSFYWEALLLRFWPQSMAALSLSLLLTCLILTLLLTRVVYVETSRNGPLALLYFCSVMYMGVHHQPYSGYSWHAVLFSAVAIFLLTRSRLWEPSQTSARTAVPDAVPGAQSSQEDLPRLLLIGMALGAAVGSKQNIGSLILAAFLLWLAYAEFWSAAPSWRRPFSRSLTVLSGACAAPAVIALYLYRQGNLAGFFQTMMKSPIRYRDVLSSSYFSIFTAPRAWSSVPNWLLEQTMLLVLLAGLGGAVALLASPWMRRWGRSHAWLERLSRVGADPRSSFWVLLYLFSFLSLFPRAGFAYAAFIAPFCLAAILILASRLWNIDSPTARTRVRALSTAVCLAYTAVMWALLADFALQYRRGQVVVFQEFPARGMLTNVETARFVQSVRRAIERDAPNEKGLLIAHPFACFLYPYIGYENPIHRYYFLDRWVTTSEQKDILAMIKAGRIKSVLIQEPRFGKSPEMLYAYAAKKMVEKANWDAFHFHLFASR